MKRVLSAVLWLVASIAFAQAPDAARHALKNAVVRITADGRQGAGIVVGSDEDTIFIVTAKHVVGEAEKATVAFNAARHRDRAAVVQNHSECLDLAVVHVSMAKDDEVRKSLKPLAYRADRVPLLTVVSNIAHSSDGWDPNFGVNKLQGERLNTLNFSSGDVVPGASGGPLFDDGNRLIGMVTQIERSRATAVKMQAILAELEFWEVRTDLLAAPPIVVAPPVAVAPCSAGPSTGTATVTINCSAPRFNGCGIEVDIVLGGVKAHVTKAGARITGVPLGRVTYRIAGKTSCPGMSEVTGSGDVIIESDVTLYLRARGGAGVPADSGLLMLVKDLAQLPPR